MKEKKLCLPDPGIIRLADVSFDLGLDRNKYHKGNFRLSYLGTVTGMICQKIFSE